MLNQHAQCEPNPREPNTNHIPQSQVYRKNIKGINKQQRHETSKYNALIPFLYP